MTVYLPDWFLDLESPGQHEAEVSELVQYVTKSSAEVKVEQLRGGITNRLVLVEQSDLKLLVRSFGKGTDTFIDRDREFAVHQCLQRLGLAPTLYSRFGNGLIYGYIPGRPTTADELDDEYIMTQISHRLAQWHAMLKPSDVTEALHGKSLGDFWQVLEKWVSICPDEVLPLTKTELQQEFAFLKSHIADRGGDEVMGHCDLLSANILVLKHLKNCPSKKDSSDSSTENTDSSAPTIASDSSHLSSVPLGTKAKDQQHVASAAAFIDYEYSIPCPRAFDIANHFQEWQGYECKKERVPLPDISSEKLKFWCQHYLHALEILTGEKQSLEKLTGELKVWWGMPGFYWGVWSAIQSKNSNIDFGYHEYASNRFQEYLDWKKAQQ